MANKAVTLYSWIGAYIELNKYKNGESDDQTAKDEDQRNLKMIFYGNNFDEDQHEMVEENDEIDLKIVRNPTFFPRSTRPTGQMLYASCENCGERDDASNFKEESVQQNAGQLQESVKNQVLVIEARPAVTFCRDCRLSMCRRCCECHGVMKTNRDHRLLPLIPNDNTTETFVKKSVRTKQRRKKFEKYLKLYQSAEEHHLAQREAPRQRQRETDVVLDTDDLEVYASDCHESVKIHRQIDEKVSELTRRIEHIQWKLNEYDEVADEFCENMLSTQVAMVETGELIRRNVEEQLDALLERMKKAALRFCLSVEDKKEELVGSMTELMHSRSALLIHKTKPRFTYLERDKMKFLLENISTIQNTIMSRNRDLRERLEIRFTPLDIAACCPSIGILDLHSSNCNADFLYSHTANLLKVVPFDNEVRGVTALRNQLAIVTANSPTLFFVNTDTFEITSSFKVKDLRNPYDLVSDESEALYISEWSDKFIHKVILSSKQVAKIPTKDPYSTLSLTPRGHVLATCPIKNKAREFDNKSKHKSVHFGKEGSRSVSGNMNGSSLDEATSGCGGGASGSSGHSNGSNGIGDTRNVCHTLALKPSSSMDENCNYNYIFCSTDSQLNLADDKGLTTSCYKKTWLSNKSKSQNISLSLHRPSHLALDKDGLLYVCDGGNDRIVVLDQSLNFIKEVLPPGLDGIKNPLRIFLDNHKSRLYVAATNLYIYELF